MALRILAALAAFSLLAAPAAAAPAPAPFGEALDSAVRDLCGRQIALLGEADHGDGRTVAFKAALVRRLVDRCGYKAIFFEASQYDFLAIGRKVRRREPVTADMVASAVGGLWKFDRELAPLFPYLAAQAASGRLVLGGIDDQVGSAGAFYSVDEMPAELSSRLAGARREQCRLILRRRIYWDYGDSPYAEPERARILSCLAEVETALRSDPRLGRVDRDELLEMAASFRRNVARDFLETARMVTERDRALYDHFRRLAARLPARSKIIVWGATNHMAKDASGTAEYAAAPNFGAFVHRAYGPRAFALGFSAASGTHYWSRAEPARRLDAAAPGSLEARAVAGHDREAVYLGPSRLRALGRVEASAFMHHPVLARWSEALDGLVVFREERAPDRSK